MLIRLMDVHMAFEVHFTTLYTFLCKSSLMIFPCLLLVLVYLPLSTKLKLTPCRSECGKQHMRTQLTQHSRPASPPPFFATHPKSYK